jgi:hypothetical protein
MPLRIDVCGFSYLQQLDASCSVQGPWFTPTAVHVGFMVDKLDFSHYLSLHYHYHSTTAPYLSAIWITPALLTDLTVFCGFSQPFYADISIVP